MQAYKAKLAPVIASVDLFCVPTAPTHYTTAGVLADPVETNSRNGTYTNFVNLLDMCGIAVPTCRVRDYGLPMSVTLLAAAGLDGLVASRRARFPCRERPHPRRDWLAAAEGAACRAHRPKTARSNWWWSALTSGERRLMASSGRRLFGSAGR